MENKRLNCRNCRHYYITWDKQFPYGCKLYGVKSKQMPSVIVYRSLGKQCEAFQQK